MEQTQYRVSVIIPVYNAQQYLDRCVRSLLLQTLPELEIILVNDGSADDSGSMCDAYAARYAHIRVLHLENGGPARARNRGMEIARGTYIGFVDSDDYVDPSMFEKLYELAERTHSDIAMCSYAVDADGVIRPRRMAYQPLYSGDEIREGLLRRYYFGRHDGLYSMCNKLFRRSLIAEHAVAIDETLRRGEDAWFVFDCLKNAGVVSFLPEALYYYYQNGASIMHSLSKDQFEKWTYSRNRLLEENKTLRFELDWELFYREYLYKTVTFCRELVSSGELALVRSILEDPALHRAIPYRGRLPGHIRFLLWLTEKHHYRAAIMAYRLWGMRK